MSKKLFLYPCPHCGKEIRSDGKYCDHCGKPVTAPDKQEENSIKIKHTPISFIVNEKGVAEEVTVSHHFRIEKGVIISQKAVITPKGTKK